MLLLYIVKKLFSFALNQKQGIMQNSKLGESQYLLI